MSCQGFIEPVSGSFILAHGTRPETLCPASSLSLLTATFVGGPGHLGLLTRRSGSEGIGHELAKAFDDFPLIGSLATMALADHSQNALIADAGGQALINPFLLDSGKTGRVLQIKQKCDPSGDLVDVLPTRPAASRRGKAKFIFRYGDSLINSNPFQQLPS